MTIIIFIIILAALILVHEFGHFIVAKKSGIFVEEFGLGFPPKIISRKIGETLYTLNLIPFGGFVKILGEDSHIEDVPENLKPRSFVYKPKWIQAAVLSAGVTMNIIFAWLLISLGFMIGIPSPVDHVGPGQVENPKLTITEVIQNSPAQIAGLLPGDQITMIVTGNGTLKGEFSSDQVRNLIQSSTGDVEITYTRGNHKPNTISVTPKYDATEKAPIIGIGMDQVGILKLSFGSSFIEGARSTWQLTEGTFLGIVHFLWDAVRFKTNLSQISGPIGIAKVVGQANTLGFVYLLSITALISINLAIINLMPLPALDGGRLFFVLIEAIIKRPISPKVVRWTNTVGFALLIILMIVVTTHDILKLL